MRNEGFYYEVIDNTEIKNRNKCTMKRRKEQEAVGVSSKTNIYRVNRFTLS